MIKSKLIASINLLLDARPDKCWRTILTK